MNTPADLHYTATHEWVRREPDGTLSVGITDYAQDVMGELVFIEPPQAGREVIAGKECGVVESVKAASDIYAPLSGRVVGVNNDVIGEPALVNKSPYDSWLFRLAPDPGQSLDHLLDAVAYSGTLAHK